MNRLVSHSVDMVGDTETYVSTDQDTPSFRNELKKNDFNTTFEIGFGGVDTGDPAHSGIISPANPIQMIIMTISLCCNLQ